MKLLVKNDKIVGAANDTYRGPMKYVSAPVGFELKDLARYKLVNGMAVGPDIQQIVIEEVTKLLDSTAAARNYGDARTSPTVSIATYVDDKNIKFRTEARAFQNWRSDMWTTCYVVMGQVIAGELPMPQSFEDIRHFMPTFSWEDVDVLTAQAIAANGGNPFLS